MAFCRGIVIGDTCMIAPGGIYHQILQVNIQDLENLAKVIKTCQSVRSHISK